MNLNESINIMKNEIIFILERNKPTIYLYGSVALDDFKLGWSDIDILVLTEYEITEFQAKKLVELRQNILESYPCNLYFRLFEGGILSVKAFLSGRKERVVYWGTSGQRITDNYIMDSFGMTELLESGILLYGEDVRDKMTYPTYVQMRYDIISHTKTARKYGVVVGWLLDIARGIFTLRTGKIISKTAAGEWALEKGLCPDTDILRYAVQIRKEPLCYSKEDRNNDNAVIQRFADVLEDEMANTVQNLAESELYKMGIKYNTLTLIRNKDSVSVWRVVTDYDSFVMKCFEKLAYCREISNYRILSSLGIPTLNIIAYTDYSLLMEDIEKSAYRLGTAEDIDNPKIAKLLAGWYRILHEQGKKYSNINTLYDECESLTLENLRDIQEKTNTSDLPVWRLIEEHFNIIYATVMSLPRTLTYNDFHYTNFAIARDGASALVFDFNMLGKGYVYSDIRNVCCGLGSEEAKTAFLLEYGVFNEYEEYIDNVVCPLISLYIACQRNSFPSWGFALLDMVKDGRLLSSVIILLEGHEAIS